MEKLLHSIHIFAYFHTTWQNVASTINNKNVQVKAENFKCYGIRTRPAKKRQGRYNVKKLCS